MRAGAIAAVAALAFGACGTEAGPRDDPFQAVEQEFDRSERSPTVRAAPRWERVAVLAGAGSARRTVRIADGAIQWRARWTCRTGDLRLTVQPVPAGSTGSQAPCPGAGRAEFIGDGRHEVAVRAAGPWRIVVEQQVETPLAEPPLAQMSAPGARLLARAPFRSIERPSSGRALLYRLPSGRLALRFEDFRTSANTDLFVWLSKARAPATTRAALRAPHRVAAPLKSTAGDQNYLLPRSVDARDVTSIVIWCDPIRIAYAAAPLGRGARATRHARGRSPGTGGPSK